MIKFPKVHIAESVGNRILNFYDEIQAGRIAQAAAPEIPVVPEVPSAAVQGQALDAATTQVPGELQAPGGVGPEVGPGAIARGADLIESLP